MKVDAPAGPEGRANHSHSVGQQSCGWYLVDVKSTRILDKDDFTGDMSIRRVGVADAICTFDPKFFGNTSEEHRLIGRNFVPDGLGAVKEQDLACNPYVIEPLARYGREAFNSIQ